MRIPSMNGAGNYTALQNFLKSMNNTNSTANDPLQNVYQNMMSKDTVAISAEAKSLKITHAGSGSRSRVMDESIRVKMPENTYKYGINYTEDYVSSKEWQAQFKSRGGIVEKLSTLNLGNTAKAPDSIEDYTERLRVGIEQNMKNLGISLDDDEKIEFTIGEDRLIKISGFKDEAKSKSLQDAMNTAYLIDNSGRNPPQKTVYNPFQTSFFINSDYAKSAESFREASMRAFVIDLKDSANEQIKRLTGIDIDFSKMRKNEHGSIEGYPKELEWIFKGEFTPVIFPDTSDAETRKTAKATQVLNITNALLDAGYDNIPDLKDLNVKFTFTSDDFNF